MICLIICHIFSDSSLLQLSQPCVYTRNSCACTLRASVTRALFESFPRQRSPVRRIYILQYIYPPSNPHPTPSTHAPPSKFSSHLYTVRCQCTVTAPCTASAKSTSSLTSHRLGVMLCINMIDCTRVSKQTVGEREQYT